MAAVATLPVRSRLIDGEAIVSDGSGLAVAVVWTPASCYPHFQRPTM